MIVFILKDLPLHLPVTPVGQKRSLSSNTCTNGDIEGSEHASRRKNPSPQKRPRLAEPAAKRSPLQVDAKVLYL